MTFAVTPQPRPFAAARALAALAVLAAGVAASAALAQEPAPAKPAPPPAFAVCSACHESTANAPPSLGPNLFNVGGRKAGATDYDYSPAMKASGVIWTPETLTPFILNPSKAMPGNKMDYDGAPDEATAKAIADYLMTLKG
jgi:cytochrome c